MSLIELMQTLIEYIRCFVWQAVITPGDPPPKRTPCPFAETCTLAWKGERCVGTDPG